VGAAFARLPLVVRAVDFGTATATALGQGGVALELYNEAQCAFAEKRFDRAHDPGAASDRDAIAHLQRLFTEGDGRPRRVLDNRPPVHAAELLATFCYRLPLLADDAAR